MGTLNNKPVKGRGKSAAPSPTEETPTTSKTED